MEAFFTITFSFPTLFWTGLLLFCLLYWAVALMGLADLDTPDIDADLPDGGLEGIAGVMASLGLGEVPLSVALTAVSLCGWTISYFGDLLVLSMFASGFPSIIGGALVLLVSAALSIKSAAIVIGPLKPLFRNSRACNNDVLGKTGVAIYAISDTTGVLDCMVNGAHLRLEARSHSEIAPGEKAVVIKYHKHDAVYQVVPEADFLTGMTR
ncbi:hypothetical protein [Marinobacter confluentis]|uniref:DUF1449 family protein n=1 Tax=Marinobacter confluentis TaxID=1697557 RepID=A0A4Z1BZV6_9GAMM|nr:hypothetical protein [Marinobacter confluentis]TGN39173.1 hypothetical protein E5Q11_10985 [Marinobacter confluentis]